jgi:hypothetical protein
VIGFLSNPSTTPAGSTNRKRMSYKTLQRILNHLNLNFDRICYVPRTESEIVEDQGQTSTNAWANFCFFVSSISLSEDPNSSITHSSGPFLIKFVVESAGDDTDDFISFFS